MRAFHYCFILLSVLISGCYFFGQKGVLDKNRYLIVKLEIDDRVILSPQELANKAKREGGKIDEGKKNSYDKFAQSQSSRLDSINADFEQLKSINDDYDDESHGTPLDELANITLVSTMEFDRAQDVIYGRVGCNDYTAKFFWQDNTRIVISGAASTRKVCSPKEVTDFQDSFIKNFDGIYVITQIKNNRGFVLNNGRLRIYIHQ